jgi:hypothetical protein
MVEANAVRSSMVAADEFRTNQTLLLLLLLLWLVVR